MATAATPAVSAEKGGFWIRFAALLIDALIIGIPASIVSALLGLANQTYPKNQFLGLIVFLVYFTYTFSANGFMGPGQTIGMRILRLRVVTPDGGSLDFTKALIRAVVLAAEIYTLIGWLGLIWIAFDANKQAVHDKAAGTYVVRV